MLSSVVFYVHFNLYGLVVLHQAFFWQLDFYPNETNLFFLKFPKINKSGFDPH